MSQRPDLRTVLDAWRHDANVLRRAGHVADADLRVRMADEVAEAAEEWLLWLSETEAALRSSRSRDWLRARFADWQRDGHAERRGRDRFYRACVIPRRSAVVVAQAAGLEAARALREQAA